MADNKTLVIGGKELKDIDQLGGYNDYDRLSSKLHSVGGAGYLVSMVPSPWTKVGGAALGFGSSLAGDIVDLINGRVSFPGLLGRTGLNVAAMVIPGSHSSRAIKSLEGASTVPKYVYKANNALNKAGRGMTEPFLEMKAFPRYLVGTAAGLGATYLPEGAMNENGDNLFIGGYNEFMDDLRNIKQGGPFDRAMKIVSIPLFLRNPRAARTASAVSSASRAAEAAETAEAAARVATDAAEAATEGEIIVTGGGVVPEEAAVAAATEAAAAEAAATGAGEVAATGAGEGLTGGAAILAGAIANANKAKAASKKKGKPVPPELMYLRNNKKKKQNKKPKTTTGTYTGKPLDNKPLLSGLIIGRKNGGKLNNLINLRNY